MVLVIAEACIDCVNATASYSDREMHAALEVNIPNYANAIMTTKENRRRALLLVSLAASTAANSKSHGRVRAKTCPPISAAVHESQWHEAEVFADAAIPSGYRVTYAV